MSEGFWHIDVEQVGAEIRDSEEGISDMSLGDVMSRAEEDRQESGHGGSIYGLVDGLTDWLVKLADDLDRIGYRVSEEYPAAGTELKTLGRQAAEWVKGVSVKGF